MNAKLSVLVSSEMASFRESWAVNLESQGIAVELCSTWAGLGELLAQREFHAVIMALIEASAESTNHIAKARQALGSSFPPLLGLLISPAPTDLCDRLTQLGVDDVLPQQTDPMLIAWKIGQMARSQRSRQPQEQSTNVERWIENSPDGIIVADADRKITFTNPAFRSLLHSPQDLPPRLLDLFDEEGRESLRLATESLQPKFCPPLRIKLCGALHAQQEVEVTHMTLSDYSLVLGVRPVIHYHELDHHAIVSQRLDVLGQLTGGIAHDLNNVLNAVIGGTSLLELDASDALKPQIKTILATARRGGNLLQQLLLFSRGVDGILEPTNLNDLTRECASIAADTFPSNIEVRVHRAQPEDLPQIQANAAQLHQILMNLCVNARDVMPDGGILALSTDQCHLDAHAVETLAAARVVGDYLTVKVTDTGSGIPENVRARIFEPFFTTKPKGKGTGLGLPTVSRLMQLHGGFVDIQSTMGQGTSVTCYFPRES